MDRISAIERLREEFITEQELATLFNVDVKRIRDQRSHHVQGKIEFINHFKPSGKSVLYRYKDVLAWIEQQDACTFGSKLECDGSDVVSD